MKITGLIYRMISFINKLDGKILIFIILCCNFLSFHLNSNEEAHLQTIKHYFDPQWILNSFTLSDWPGHRILFYYLSNWLLSIFDFETTVFIGRILCFLLLLIPLSGLFKLLRFSNMEILLLLQLLYFPNQAFFAGEWIFGGFEPKTLSYPFVFMALYYLLKGKNFLSSICIVAATYLHVLVGVWFFVLFFLYMIVARQKMLTTVSALGIYLLLLAPYFYYLLYELVVKYPTEIHGVNTDWITVYYRYPHHLGLFLNPAYFFYFHLPGILFAISFLLISFFVFKKILSGYEKTINTLLLIILLLLMLFVFIAYFDNHGAIMKFHPYRLAALGLFFAFTLLVILIKKYFLQEKYIRQGYLIILFLALPVLGYAALRNADESYWNYFKKDTPVNRLAEFVKQNTKPDDVFLMAGFEDVSFFRKMKREIFVTYKISTFTSNRIYEWYQRIQEKEKIEKNIFYLEQSLKKYRLDYIVSHSKYHSASLTMVYDKDEYYVYKITK